MNRFDVIFDGSKVSIDYHFCRDHDCFGTNDSHGFSFKEAKEVVVKHLEEELKTWRSTFYEEWRRNNHPTEEEVYEDMEYELER